jgi:hypothetical protein
MDRLVVALVACLFFSTWLSRIEVVLLFIALKPMLIISPREASVSPSNKSLNLRCTTTLRNSTSHFCYVACESSGSR